MVGFFAAGLLLGAEVIAVVAAILGGLTQHVVPAAVRLGLLAAVATAVLLRETGAVSFRVPENTRLVPERVQGLGELGALQFGFEMGTGMRTYSPSALPHLVLTAALLVISLPGAVLLGAGFAAGRLAMPVLSNAYSDDGAWSELWARRARPLAVLLTLTVLGSLTTLVVLGPAWVLG